MKTIIYLTFFFLPFMLFSQEATYRNPVIAGDCPDPTVIRAGDTYYAAGTSSEWAPPYRLFESKDLVNWTYLGPMFKEMPDWTVGSYWAPELFYHKGTFFVYYTARRASDRKSFIGVATTRDIKQGFTDHGLIVEWTNEAIDAFVNEIDGRLYITWKAYGLDRGKTIEILGSELTEDGLKLKGDVFSLLIAERDSWEAGGIEGQCIVKRNDYFYMFYAGNGCCGANCNYQTGVARAKSIRGPWEKYADNPVLHSGGQWRCPGHGTVVTTPDNRYFFLYHAYNSDVNIFLGRQGLLDEIIWDEKTGWPAFRYGKIPSIQAEMPYSGAIQKTVADFVDNFQTEQLGHEWIWDASQIKPEYKIKDGKLFLTGNNTPVGTFLGLRQQKPNYTMQATVSKSANYSGICIYGTKDNAIGISRIGNRIELWKNARGVWSVIETAELPETGNIELFLQTRFGRYTRFGFINLDGRRVQLGGLIEIGDLPQWDRPPMVGIHTNNDGAEGVFEKITVNYL